MSSIKTGSSFGTSTPVSWLLKQHEKRFDCLFCRNDHVGSFAIPLLCRHSFVRKLQVQLQLHRRLPVPRQLPVRLQHLRRLPHLRQLPASRLFNRWLWCTAWEKNSFSIVSAIYILCSYVQLKHSEKICSSVAESVATSTAIKVFFVFAVNSLSLLPENHYGAPFVFFFKTAMIPMPTPVRLMRTLVIVPSSTYDGLRDLSTKIAPSNSEPLRRRSCAIPRAE